MQRSLAEEIPNTAVVPSIDLELDDLIHIGTQGFKRLGRRLAKIALHDMEGRSGTRPGIHLRSVAVEGEERMRVRVSFHGVAAGGLVPSLQVRGFSFHRADGTLYNLIYKAQTDPQNPSDVVLHLVMPLPEGFSLRYGYGFHPVCTLTDTDDMTAPVFGPIAL